MQAVNHVKLCFLRLESRERVGQFDSHTLITSQISLKRVSRTLEMLQVWNGFMPSGIVVDKLLFF